MNLTEHGVMEIGYLHLEDKEKESYLKKFVKEFLEEFGEQGHSGNSAPFAIAGFKKYTKGKTFVDKEIKDIIEPPLEYKDNDPDTWMSNDVYNLVKKYHELVNTEEFIVHDIDESWIQNILYRLMDWKPITPLQGTTDEWYTEKDRYPLTMADGKIHYQNKRCSSVFAIDLNGKDAYNIDGRVFTRNGISFTNIDSKVNITFPYEIPDKREVVQLEDYVKVDESPSYYAKLKYGDNDEEKVEYTIGFLPSTLDTSINNPKFYKAEYCVLASFNNTPYINILDCDEPIYYIRMVSRFKEFIKNERIQKKEIIMGIYTDKECTIEAEL